MDKLELKITSDGSYTLFLPNYEETYHSIHGAVQEALHVFIDAGLKQYNNSSISILEIGFGTGLNCLLTLMANEEKSQQISYTGIEAYPVDIKLIEQLDYPGLLQVSEMQADDYFKMHYADWESVVSLTGGFSLQKKRCKFEDYQTNESYDIIYYDAFGPRVQPDLWGEKLMLKMYEGLNSGGCLVTYCAKGSFKRALKSVGFEVECLPGPPGKREMTRAWKK